MAKKKRIVKSGHSKGRMLTPKQEKFVRELIKSKSQREAYKAAYNASRMKDVTIDRKACGLFKQDNIRARYDELQKKVKDRTVYDAAEVRQVILDTLMAIVTADVADDVVDGRAVKNKRWDNRNRVIYDHYDKLEAAKMLREMLGIDMDSNTNGITIKIENGQGYDE
jgi:phage terminase small subunit